MEIAKNRALKDSMQMEIEIVKSVPAFAPSASKSKGKKGESLIAFLALQNTF
jgi:hypothetical protein